MIDYLLTAMESAVDSQSEAAELERHLDGVGAIMESHFAYEERQLLHVLETLDLSDDPRAVLGSS